jgi:hypothetical protein
MSNKIIARLLNKEMDRKDFLKYGGSVLLAVIGVSGLINALLKPDGESLKGSRGGSGYGGDVYGG